MRAYWSRVIDQGCAVHGYGCPSEIAHVVGKPSVTERIKEPKPKGKKLPRHDWLVIALCPAMHRLYCWSLDNAADEWESKYGETATMIDELAAAIGVDPWALSQIGRK